MQATTTTSTIKQRAPRKFAYEWQNHLQAVRDIYDKHKNPSYFIANGSRRGSWNDATANGLTAAIVDYLTYLGGNFSRVNCIGTPRKNSSGQLIFTPSTTKKGIADIIGCYRGKYIAIEIKIGADRQSKEQIEEQRDVINAGGVYIIAKSFPDFLSNMLNISTAI